MRQILARKDLVQLGEIEIGSWRYRYGSLFLSQLRLSPKQLDEIATMDGGMCILQLRGVRPFFSKKYDITKHPRYKYLSDADKKNTFDVERYIRVQRKKKKHPSAVIAPEEPFDLYEIELSDEDTDLTATE